MARQFLTELKKGDQSGARNGLNLQRPTPILHPQALDRPVLISYYPAGLHSLCEPHQWMN
jgi:hypothetical protein